MNEKHRNDNVKPVPSCEDNVLPLENPQEDVSKILEDQVEISVPETDQLPNPFEPNPVNRNFGYFVFWAFSLVLCPVVFPLRLILAVVTIFLAWFVNLFLSIGADPSKPYGRVRRAVVTFFSSMFGRLLSFSLGIVWISQKNRHNRKASNANLMTSLHVTSADALVYMSRGISCLIAKHDVASYKGIGQVARNMPCIFVDRSSAESRERAKQEIRAKCTVGSGWAPLLAFVEGTTTNARTIIPFKVGAFLPGQPLLPCYVKWSSRFLDSSDAGESMINNILRMMLALGTTAQIVWLPPYQPTAEEQQDPLLYAGNVREVISELTGRPVVPYGYRDKLVYRGQSDYSTASPMWRAAYPPPPVVADEVDVAEVLIDESTPLMMQ